MYIFMLVLGIILAIAHLVVRWPFLYTFRGSLFTSPIGIAIETALGLAALVGGVFLIVWSFAHLI